MESQHSSSNAFSLENSALMPQEEMLEIGKKKQKLLIGIPKETDINESRIGLTPFAVDLLVQNGHTVLIESNAGVKANFSNEEYIKVGGDFTSNREDIYNCDIILKTSPLNEREISLLRGNQILFTTLHSAFQKRGYYEALIQKRVSAFAFEYIKDDNGCYPIVRSMSEIAGSTSILIAAEYLSNVHDGKGEMLGGITGVNPSEVTILGAGTAGEFAARTAIGLGASVKVFDQSLFRLRSLQDSIGQRLNTSLLQPRILAKKLKSSDVVIGAVRATEGNLGFCVTEEMIKGMKKNSVIIDLSIDQGGCFETSKLTSHKNPVFVQHDVIHYCVPNISSRVARTASYAISNIFAPLLLKFAEVGSIKQVIKSDVGLRNGIYLYNGILTKSNIGEKFNLTSKDINLLLAAF